MRGFAESSCAVSLVNAIPTGIGAALAISTRITVEAEVKRDPGVDVEYMGVNPGDEALVEAAACVIGERTGWRGGWKVRIRSELPPRRGLKTSSAAANSLAAAMMEAAGMEPSWMDILDYGIEAARRAGITVTGALDDAAASLLGGLAVTDNRRGTILDHRHLSLKDVVVILAISMEEIPKGDIDRGRFMLLAPAAEVALRLVGSGKYAEAMTLNGMLVTSALHLDMKPVMDSLKAGALAAGVTGTGPSLAALTRKCDVDTVVAALKGYFQDIRVYNMENRPGVWYAEV